MLGALLVAVLIGIWGFAKLILRLLWQMTVALAKATWWLSVAIAAFLFAATVLVLTGLWRASRWSVARTVALVH